ncbi:MAG TPA: twin-arginine translocation pathway signal, partial [Sphingobium sp.]|nr:twin-arginine translocation pathway signal [Sphingobium sp.]
MTRADFLRLMAGGLSSAMLARPLAAATGGYDFWFTRLRYDSGDWDVDQRAPSNIIT